MNKKDLSERDICTKFITPAIIKSDWDKDSQIFLLYFLQMVMLFYFTIERLIWAKKILEWTISPNEALKIAINLNDKYAYDAPSSNGYVGILWAIGALHDRAFMDYPTTGKIRRMTYNSTKNKYDITKYINTYNSNIYQEMKIC